MDSHRQCDGGGRRLVGFYRHERGEFSSTLLSHTGKTLREFTRIMKTVKHNMQFENETRVEGPDRKAVLIRVQFLSRNCRLSRLLSVAEPLRPCHRQVN